MSASTPCATVCAHHKEGRRRANDSAHEPGEETSMTDQENTTGAGDAA